MTIDGQDWASYQVSAPSTTGLSFAFIKATEGTGYVNPKQSSQADTARKAGLVVGFYHFLHPGNVQAQAEYFVSKAVSKEGDILVCDWEPTSSGTPSNADKDAFIKAVQKLRPTHRVILYCDVARWTNVDKTSFCGDGLWIADPNHPKGHPNIVHPWLIHQYSMAGGIDRDVANFATKAAMFTWAKGKLQSTTPPPPPAPTPTPTPVVDKPDVKDATYKSVWDLDAAQPPAGHATTTNPTWAPMSLLRGIYEKVEAMEKEIAALKAKLGA